MVNIHLHLMNLTDRNPDRQTDTHRRFGTHTHTHTHIHTYIHTYIHTHSESGKVVTCTDYLNTSSIYNMQHTYNSVHKRPLSPQLGPESPCPFRTGTG